MTQTRAYLLLCVGKFFFSPDQDKFFFFFFFPCGSSFFFFLLCVGQVFFFFYLWVGQVFFFFFTKTSCSPPLKSNGASLTKNKSNLWCELLCKPSIYTSKSDQWIKIWWAQFELECLTTNLQICSRFFYFRRHIGQHAIGFIAWLEHFVRVFWSHQDPSVSPHGATG